jgi:monovalent cation:H+ antiporter-2, CPA2 family
VPAATFFLLVAEQTPFVLDLLTILAAAGLVSLLLRRFNVATIPGYLVAGAIVGPHGLGMASGEGSDLFHLATVLLMFIIGLHLDLTTLRSGWVSAAMVGLIAASLCIAMGWPVALLLGLPPIPALMIVMALSISSTAVVLRLMEQKRELHKPRGRLTLGILIFQDLLVLGMMAAIPILRVLGGAGAEGEALPPLQDALREVVIAVVGIASLIVLGRWALPRILRAAADSAELLLVLSAGMALGAAVAAAGLGFSPELGSFLAGFLLASTPFRYQLSGQLVPLRDLLLAVFFTALGLQLPLDIVAEGWWIILIAFVLTVVIKAGTMAFAAWGGGSTGPIAVFAGLGLAQGSEFSLVLLTQALAAGIITATQSAYAVATVLLSLVFTPLLMRAARELAPRATGMPLPPWVSRPVFHEEARPRTAESQAPEETEVRARVIIAGFGPVGRAVADVLEREHAALTIVELNPRTVERQRTLGRYIVFGDASNGEVLERAGLAEADAVILTMPDEDAVLRSARAIRTLHPKIFIAARVGALSKAIQAMQLGADHVVVEELATADAMASQVMMKLQQVRSGKDTGPKLYRFGG